MKFFWNVVFALNLNFRARLFFRQIVSSSDFFFVMNCSIKFYHFFFVIRKCYLKNYVIRIFFFSIDMKVWCYKSKTHFWWCCYVIFNRWKSDTNAINHQIWKMMLNEYHIYVMKNDLIKKFFIIQKIHKNFYFVHFFFDKFFSISNFWRFKSLNLIKQFQLFSKISKKTVFQIIFRNVQFFSFSTDSVKCYDDDFAKF